MEGLIQIPAEYGEVVRATLWNLAMSGYSIIKADGEDLTLDVLERGRPWVHWEHG